MPSIDVSNYYLNQVNLNMQTIGYEYKETVKLILIPINNIISIVIDPFFLIGHKRIKDIKNNRYTITRSTIEALYKFLTIYNNFTSISPSLTSPPSPRTNQPAQRKTQKTSRTYKFGFSFFFPKRNKTTITTTTPHRTPRTTRTVKDNNLFYIINMLSKVVVFIGSQLIINSDSTQTIKYIMI